jgi:hypothetical protein
MNDVWKNRQIDDYQRMCEKLVAEKQAVRKILTEIAVWCEREPQTSAEAIIAKLAREALALSSQDGGCA